MCLKAVMCKMWEYCLSGYYNIIHYQIPYLLLLGTKRKYEGYEFLDYTEYNRHCAYNIFDLGVH
jgi:predicted secreted protein